MIVQAQETLSVIRGNLIHAYTVSISHNLIQVQEPLLIFGSLQLSLSLKFTQLSLSLPPSEDSDEEEKLRLAVVTSADLQHNMRSS